MEKKELKLITQVESLQVEQNEKESTTQLK
jgi:hypothetical protein